MCLTPLRCNFDRSYNKYLKMTVTYGSPKFNPQGDNRVPCGKCPVCISKRSIEWATRCRHEMSQHPLNTFITLTYNQDSIKSEEIVYEEFQLFMKKLRRKYPNNNIRYIVSCEYGTNHQRPHFHAIIFGYDAPDKKYLRKTPKGSILYSSDELSRLWGNGFVSIGEANEKTAYYIAKYSLSNSKHEIIRDHTGEINELADYMRCSTRPAIGKLYFEKYYRYVVADAISENKPIPRYYAKLLEKLDPELLDIYKINSESNIKEDNPQQDYNRMLIYQSKFKLSENWDRETKDFTNTFEQVKIKLNEFNNYVRDELELQKGVDLAKAIFSL